ncbi:ABC transporter permease [Proteiniclasticum sp. BAD-10]|uniref:ABC transporter permease n=1 Tax=Proteiniclasticum sediminis TaxID=2804028 RepID=A0A941CPR7_9CLOT|nr:ABC transporter permease [Proteiniclasticum sediminis]MBR0575046.1 ABC transporter permease [Proteiniclasticum sediminis]
MENTKQIKSSILKQNLEKFVRNRLAMFGLLMVGLIVLTAVFAPLITKYDPVKIDMTSIGKAPSSAHLFGTDKLGRDVFSRVLYGGRISILVGFIGSIMGSLIGMVLGCIAGYFGGKIDSLLIRISEIFQTFPQMILILIMVSILGQGVGNLIFIFSITGWMTTFRMIRNEFLTLREETFVEVSKAFGISDVSIMFRQILPNTFSPIIVATTINIAGFILAEAGLSYIGLGVPSSVPTWGNILNAAKTIDIIVNNWWLWLLPGLILSFFVLAINFLGDGLRDVLDPKQL